MPRKTVGGVVDRVEGDVVVVVVKDPGDGINKEIYVDKRKLKKVELREGDPVTVDMSMLAANAAAGNEKKPGRPDSGGTAVSPTVTLSFEGPTAEMMAGRFFSYLVDGGLEDHLIQQLSGNGATLEISDCNSEARRVILRCTQLPGGRPHRG